MIKREREEEGDRQSSTVSRLLILYLSSGFVLFWIKTSPLDSVAEATIERASADVSAKVETLFGTEESKLDKNNVL